MMTRLACVAVLSLAVLLGVAVRLLALDVVARRVFRKHGLLAVIGTAAIGAPASSPRLSQKSVFTCGPS